MNIMVTSNQKPIIDTEKKEKRTHEPSICKEHNIYEVQKNEDNKMRYACTLN